MEKIAKTQCFAQECKFCMEQSPFIQELTEKIQNLNPNLEGPIGVLFIGYCAESEGEYVVKFILFNKDRTKLVNFSFPSTPSICYGEHREIMPRAVNFCSCSASGSAAQ